MGGRRVPDGSHPSWPGTVSCGVAATCPRRRPGLTGESVLRLPEQAPSLAAMVRRRACMLASGSVGLSTLRSLGGAVVAFLRCSAAHRLGTALDVSKLSSDDPALPTSCRNTQSEPAGRAAWVRKVGYAKPWHGGFVGHTRTLASSFEKICWCLKNEGRWGLLYQLIWAWHNDSDVGRPTIAIKLLMRECEEALAAAPEVDVEIASIEVDATTGALASLLSTRDFPPECGPAIKIVLSGLGSAQSSCSGTPSARGDEASCQDPAALPLRRGREDRSETTCCVEPDDISLPEPLDTEQPDFEPTLGTRLVVMRPRATGVLALGTPRVHDATAVGPTRPHARVQTGLAMHPEMATPSRRLRGNALLVQVEPALGLMVVVGNEPLYFGRRRHRVHASLVAADQSVSQRHFRISKKLGRFILLDCGSSNGTLVNGLPIGEIPLANGDEIGVPPGYRFRFVVLDEIGGGQVVDAGKIALEVARLVPDIRRCIRLAKRLGLPWEGVGQGSALEFWEEMIDAIIVRMVDYELLEALLEEVLRRATSDVLDRSLARVRGFALAGDQAMR